MYLLIVTGLSGAGKSQALRRLEDMGYYCVDNLPSELLNGFIELCTRSSVERAAVVVDSRSNVFNADMEQALNMLCELELDHELLFLDCRDNVLERRYNETRRRHPLDDDVTLGINKERGILAPLRDRANYIIDTSDMKPSELSGRLSDFGKKERGREFLLTVESFGYKRGVPIEADMVFDMRFLPNPFYVPELRSLSGIDNKVRGYIAADGEFDRFISSVEAQLIELIPRFIAQDKRRLLVCFGCTGGRHRSVCAAQELYRRMTGKFDVTLVHRDAAVEADDIMQRAGGRRED